MEYLAAIFKNTFYKIVMRNESKTDFLKTFWKTGLFVGKKNKQTANQTPVSISSPGFHGK